MKRFNFILATLLALVLSSGAYAFGGKEQTANIDSLINDADGIRTIASIGSAGELTLNGALVSNGIATISGQPKSEVGQKVTILSAGDDTGDTFTIVGVDSDGKREAEVLTGGSGGAVHSARYYYTVISITASGASAGNVTIGTLSAQGAVTKTLVPDLAGYTSMMSIVTGTADTACVCTFSVDHTSMKMPSTKEGLWFPTLALDGIVNTDTESNIVAAVGGVRGRISAYTSGTFELLILQDQKK